MDFATAWATLAIGDVVAVSNGQPHPGSKPASLSARIWASHNFTGTLAEKIDGDRQGLRFELPPTEGGSVIGFVVAADVPHEFALAD